MDGVPVCATCLEVHFEGLCQHEWVAAPLWRVEADGGCVWLFGDQATNSRAWLSPQTESAIDGATVIWTEVPEEEDPLKSALLPALGFTPDGDLQESLGSTRWDQALQLARSVDIDLTEWRTMRPWLAAQMIDSAFMATYGADKHRPGAVLTERASVRGAEIRSEFTWDDVFRFYAALPTAAELGFVDTVLARVAAGAEGFRAESGAWLAGDTSLCEAYMEDIRSRSEELAEAIGRERNEAWVPRIESALANREVHFILVGFGHLTGPDRIQVQLESTGFSVERVE